MSDDPWNKKKSDDNDGLGSLAQSARSTSLKQARVLLFVAAAITLLQGGVAYSMAESFARQAIEAEKQKSGPFVVFDPVEVKKAEETLRRGIEAVALGVLGVGVVFIVLGVVVHLAPLPCTVIGLVIYLGLQAVFAIGDPANLVRGIIFKVIIIVGLVKAIQAAAAYQREVKAEREASRGYDRGYDD